MERERQKKDGSSMIEFFQQADLASFKCLLLSISSSFSFFSFIYESKLGFFFPLLFALIALQLLVVSIPFLICQKVETNRGNQYNFYCLTFDVGVGDSNL